MLRSSRRTDTEKFDKIHSYLIQTVDLITSYLDLGPNNTCVIRRYIVWDTEKASLNKLQTNKQTPVWE
jgi:hypothetical protein